MPRNIVPIKNPYFNMPQLKRPVFPDFIVNMKDKGMTEDVPITDLVNRTIAEVMMSELPSSKLAAVAAKVTGKPRDEIYQWLCEHKN